MNEEKAKQLFNKWVRILHLEPWNIQFQWKVRKENMNLADTVGATTYLHSMRQAIVQMIDPIDYPVSPFEYDYEKTLVHELLHLKFSDLDDTGDQLRDKLTHQMIDDMAKALVNAYREGYNDHVSGL